MSCRRGFDQSMRTVKDLWIMQCSFHPATDVLPMFVLLPLLFFVLSLLLFDFLGGIKLNVALFPQKLRESMWRFLKDLVYKNVRLRNGQYLRTS